MSQGTVLPLRPFNLLTTGNGYDTLTTGLVSPKFPIHILWKSGVSPNIIWKSLPPYISHQKTKFDTFFSSNISPKTSKWAKTFPSSLKLKRDSKWDTFGWIHVTLLYLSFLESAFENYSADNKNTHIIWYFPVPLRLEDNNIYFSNSDTFFSQWKFKNNI